jgi:hypothetical protein
MFNNFSKLPDDVILIISSYYGNKISKELSQEINDQRLLRIIKENEYYNKKHRTWHISTIGNILKEYPSIPIKLKKSYNDSLWKDKDMIINKMWNLLSVEEHQEIIKNNFPYAILRVSGALVKTTSRRYPERRRCVGYHYNSEFITFNEFFYSNFGYYINHIPYELKSNSK